MKANKIYPKKKVYRLMFKGLIVDVFDTYEEASEECAIRNYEYANETAYLGEYNYHRYYIQEDIYENL